MTAPNEELIAEVRETASAIGDGLSVGSADARRVGAIADALEAATARAEKAEADAVRRFIGSIDRDGLAVKIAHSRYPDGWWPTKSGVPDSAVVVAAAVIAYLDSLAPDSKAGE